MYRMSSGYASVLVNTLSAQGLDVASLCREAGLDMKLANKPGAFCERRAIYRLWDLAAQASGDSEIGLKAYGSFHPGSFQIVGYTMMSSLNLKKALERLVRFSPLIGTGFSLFFTSEPQGYRLSGLDHQQKGSIKPRQYTDAALASLLGFCRKLAGGNSPQPLSVEFTYPEPEDTSEHRRLFGCDLRFDAAYDSILFDGQELLRPLSMANEALAVLHDSFAEAQLDLQFGFCIVGRIRALITERLSQGQGQCDMESIAAALNVSKRTLQRALEKEGTQFKDVQNAVRRQLADFYLRHSHFNMKHVAYLLGFHDHSSFNKACSRWFGMTPGQYRADESLAIEEAAPV
ncbi:MULTISPECIES: AraC family transcriptional regulator [Pseudomonas]|uniref:AraC family transcriptional regulator n=2 Tax=Gammaproteobacteria TaxID=1236 RepID=A0A423IAV5_9PSED|nr:MULTISPECIES: AraC family transcriptional regulator [Pseudomonas]MBK5310147.1 AraC family transcriptional regulator [Pseudomonas sp. TH71]MBK5369351.1 AraC family transcriptional regulator [Pseudomonas sp. TH40]MBK5380520.1 AraC family transcriptional regulator [Pseudomonas sp. TH35]MBK5385979.1 AraC family transcriptional regulator [Pseudomonas sp. TH38]MBK5403274.1 AraC family transcriptional regulator [Pseudomonas sp. TH37]MBK5465372.1 AraC family transcriptional regulator [Pseudomonas 